MVKHYALDNRYFEGSRLLQEMRRRGWSEGVLEGKQEGKQLGFVPARATLVL